MGDEKKLNMLINCHPIVQTRKGVFCTTPNGHYMLNDSEVQ